MQLSATKKLVFCAICVALCVVLPMAFHAVSYTHLDVYKRQDQGSAGHRQHRWVSHMERSLSAGEIPGVGSGI